MDDQSLTDTLWGLAEAADRWLGTWVDIVGGGGLSFLLIVGVLGIALGLYLGRRTARPDREAELLLLEKPAEERPGSALARETGVSDDMLDVLRARLREWGTAPDEFEDHLRVFAQQYRDMSAVVSASLSDRDLGDIAVEVKKALNEGDIRAAQKILSTHADESAGDGVRLNKEAVDAQRRAGAAYVLAGDMYLAQDSLQDALRHYRNALDTLPASAENLLAEALNKHGSVAFRTGNLPTAIASFEHALIVLEKILGPDHEDVATNLNNLGLIYYSQDDFAKAEPLYKRALEIDEKAFGAESQAVATDLNNLALLYKKKGDLAAAEPMFKRSIFVKERLFAPDHPSLATGLRNYAALLRAMDRDAEARVVERRIKGQGVSAA